VDHREQRPQRLAQPLAIGTIPCIRQGRQVLHIADQVRQAELEQHTELALIAPIGREVVAAQHTVELRAQDLDQHVAAAGRVDLEQRVQPGPEAPGPLPLAVLLVAGLIDIQPRLAG